MRRYPYLRVSFPGIVQWIRNEREERAARRSDLLAASLFLALFLGYGVWLWLWLWLGR